MTREPGYRLTIPDTVAVTSQARITAGSKTVYNRLNELIALGYLTRKLIKSGCDYFIHSTPLNVADGKAA